jgi:uncharacterized repeat protein (TIGR03803 family)
MKIKPVVILIIASWLAFAATAPLKAQSFTVLHNFTGTPADGAYPGGVLLSGSTLIGVTTAGGFYSYGSVYAYSTNGGQVILHSFTNMPDGAQPNELLLSSNTLYGTTVAGGTNSLGVVFKVATNGTGYAILHLFTNTPDGATPYGGLVTDGNLLYGTTKYGGGSINGGIVFRMDTNGAGYTILHTFTNTPDGYYPYAGLVLNAGTLYGTTVYGGIYSHGTVFKLATNGQNFSVIYNFSNAPDAVNPYGRLLLVSNILYGTSFSGGNSNQGAVFMLSTNNNGSGYAVLHSFKGSTGDAANSDGGYPNAGLVFNGGLLYGVTSSAGSGGGGTIFQLSPNGTGFAVVKNLNNASDGGTPEAALVWNAGTLFGTASQLGSADGTLFSLLFSPAITVQPQNITVQSGSAAGFSVTATDVSTIQYQWYFNTNTLLTGQTNSALNLAGVTSLSAGYYTVAVADNFGAVTSSPALLTVTAGVAPPSITIQPQNLTVTNGNTASFTVTPAGQTPFYYQWYFNTNTLLAGQTNSVLTFTSAANSGGYYSVIITNAGGAVTSSPALLTVVILIAPPSITTQPQALSITNGFTANFSVTAGGQSPLSYQWYFNTNTALASQTNSTVAFTSTSNTAGYYSVVVANPGGTVTSSPALLKVITATTPPIITVLPQSLAVGSGSAASFTVAASGRSPLKYQWYFNSNLNRPALLGVALNSQTNTLLTFTVAVTSNGYYSVVVTNTLGSVTSTPAALLTVITNPIITGQPQNATVTNGNPVTFTAVAVGASVLNYQWYFNTNTVLAGATNSTLNFPSASNSLAGTYLMIVTNTYGRATSSVVTLTVVTIATPSGQPAILNYSFNSGSGSFALTLTNSASSTNRLWAATNLASASFWSVIATNVMAANGLWFFTDTNIAQTNKVRFYRLSTP